jgi:hypothetical protein
MRVRFHLVIFMSVFAQIAPAQTAPTGRSIRGTVLDTTGVVIAGAQIVIATPDGQTIDHGMTDGAGSFSFTNLPTGFYVVDITKEHFREIKQPTRVSSQVHPPLRLVMPVAAVTQELAIGASDNGPQVSTEIAQNQGSNTLDRDALDRIPVFDQDYITAMSRFLDADSTGTNGITLVVNGVEANGPGVTPSAVQNVKINQNPYTALYSRPGRVRIDITTKGGTPQFHGSGNFLYRDSPFDATNAFAMTKPSEQRTYYEGSFTGPLGHNKKTTFLLALDKDRDNQQAIVVAAGPNGVINANVRNPTNHYFISGRVFHDYKQGDQFWIGYSYEHKTVENYGVGGTVLPDAGTNTLFFEHEVNLGHTHVFSQKLLNQLHFLVGHYDSHVHDLNENPQLIVSGAFTGGGAQANFRKTEYHFDGTNIVTYTSGRQEIKFGIDVPDISRRASVDFTNRQGTYPKTHLVYFPLENVDGHPLLRIMKPTSVP